VKQILKIYLVTYLWESNPVTSSIQGCPTVISSGDLKYKEALVGGITTRNVADFLIDAQSAAIT